MVESSSIDASYTEANETCGGIVTADHHQARLGIEALLPPYDAAFLGPGRMGFWSSREMSKGFPVAVSRSRSIRGRLLNAFAAYPRVIGTAADPKSPMLPCSSAVGSGSWTEGRM